MKAELRFFMSPADTQEFLAFAQDQVDAFEESRLIIGDCGIIFTPSRMHGGTLFAGSIAIDSGGLDDGCKDQSRANDVYRKLRNWIKKHYNSRLSTWTAGNEAKASRTRDYWLGPDARQWKQSLPSAIMRLSERSPSLFDIAPEVGAIGSIKPKTEKFKPRH